MEGSRREANLRARFLDFSSWHEFDPLASPLKPANTELLSTVVSSLFNNLKAFPTISSLSYGSSTLQAASAYKAFN